VKAAAARGTSGTAGMLPHFDRIQQLFGRHKIHVFQERGGCSYFQVGLRLQMQIAGDNLEVSTLDQIVESANASPAIEIALWLKQLLQGSIDRSRQAAAHTQLTVGGRAFTTRAVRAEVVDDELQFELRFSSDGSPQARQLAGAGFPVAL
jgi:hypothetical protein